MFPRLSPTDISPATHRLRLSKADLDLRDLIVASSQCHCSRLVIRTPLPVSPRLPARSPQAPPPLSAQSSPPSPSLPFRWAAPDPCWRGQGGLPEDCRNEAGTRRPPTRQHRERHPLHVDTGPAILGPPLIALGQNLPMTRLRLPQTVCSLRTEMLLAHGFFLTISSLPATCSDVW